MDWQRQPEQAREDREAHAAYQKRLAEELKQAGKL